jgi:hypothetical protein
MTTQSNRQTQNVKVVVNNKGCCEPKRRKPRRRPKQTAELPPEEVQMPPVPPLQDFARGLSAYPVRPSLYAPVSTTIQMDGGLRQVPSYFEKQLTNQQLTLEQLQRTIEDQYGDLLNQIGQMQPPPIPAQGIPPIQPTPVPAWGNPQYQPATLNSLLTPPSSSSASTPQGNPQYQPATLNSLLTSPYSSLASAPQGLTPNSSIGSAPQVQIPQTTYSSPISPLSSPSSVYSSASGSFTDIGFPPIPEVEQVPNIVRGIIDPSSAPPPVQFWNSREARKARDNPPEHLGLENTIETYGSNHPYTRALRLFLQRSSVGKRQQTLFNKQIRDIAAERNITAHSIYGVMGLLSQIERTP